VDASRAAIIDPAGAPRAEAGVGGAGVSRALPMVGASAGRVRPAARGGSIDHCVGRAGGRSAVAGAGGVVEAPGAAGIRCDAASLRGRAGRAEGVAVAQRRTVGVAAFGLPPPDPAPGTAFASTGRSAADRPALAPDAGRTACGAMRLRANPGPAESAAEDSQAAWPGAAAARVGRPRAADPPPGVAPGPVVVVSAAAAAAKVAGRADEGMAWPCADADRPSACDRVDVADWDDVADCVEAADWADWVDAADAAAYAAVCGFGPGGPGRAAATTAADGRSAHRVARRTDARSMPRPRWESSAQPGRWPPRWCPAPGSCVLGRMSLGWAVDDVSRRIAPGVTVPGAAAPGAAARETESAVVAWAPGCAAGRSGPGVPGACALVDAADAAAALATVGAVVPDRAPVGAVVPDRAPVGAASPATPAEAAVRLPDVVLLEVVLPGIAAPGAGVPVGVPGAVARAAAGDALLVDALLVDVLGADALGVDALGVDDVAWRGPALARTPEPGAPAAATDPAARPPALPARAPPGTSIAASRVASSRAARAAGATPGATLLRSEAVASPVDPVVPRSAGASTRRIAPASVRRTTTGSPRASPAPSGRPPRPRPDDASPAVTAAEPDATCADVAPSPDPAEPAAAYPASDVDAGDVSCPPVVDADPLATAETEVAPATPGAPGAVAAGAGFAVPPVALRRTSAGAGAPLVGRGPAGSAARTSPSLRRETGSSK